MNSEISATSRRARIVDLVQRHGGATVADLVQALPVSAATIHRDLERLAAEGRIERVYGGAQALPSAGMSVLPPASWEQRLSAARMAKASIAARAAGEVRPGSTIFLDSSTTCLALARELVSGPELELTLVTNSPAIAYELKDERILVIATPGELDQHMRLLAGRWTTDFLAGLHFEVAFCSCAGVTLQAGLMTTRRALADVIGVARANAQRTIGLIESAKFGRSSMLTSVHAHELDLVITDDGLDDRMAGAFRAAGVRLEIAAG